MSQLVSALFPRPRSPMNFGSDLICRTHGLLPWGMVPGTEVRFSSSRKRSVIYYPSINRFCIGGHGSKFPIQSRYSGIPQGQGLLPRTGELDSAQCGTRTGEGAWTPPSQNEELRGGVPRYVAQVPPVAGFDAEIAEKGHFWMETI